MNYLSLSYFVVPASAVAYLALSILLLARGGRGTVAWNGLRLVVVGGLARTIAWLSWLIVEPHRYAVPTAQYNTAVVSQVVACVGLWMVAFSLQRRA